MKVIKSQKKVEIVKFLPKTLVVKDILRKEHSKYTKNFFEIKKYLVHCEDAGKLKIGDEIVIVGCRPKSARKRWIYLTDNKTKK